MLIAQKPMLSALDVANLWIAWAVPINTREGNKIGDNLSDP